MSQIAKKLDKLKRDARFHILIVVCVFQLISSASTTENAATNVTTLGVAATAFGETIATCPHRSSSFVRAEACTSVATAAKNDGSFLKDSLLTAVLSSLDSRQDLARAEQVCRHWREVIRDERVWSAVVSALELHLDATQNNVLYQVPAKLPALKLLVLDVDLGRNDARNAVTKLLSELSQLRSLLLRDRSYYLKVDYMISNKDRNFFYKKFALLADHGTLEHFAGSAVLTPEVIIKFVEKCPRLGTLEGSIPGVNVVAGYDRLLHGLVAALNRRWERFREHAVPLHIAIWNWFDGETLESRARALGVRHHLLHFGTQLDPVARELRFCIKGKWL